MISLKEFIQKISIIHKAQMAKLESDFIVDKDLNLLSLKEASPEYYENSKVVLNSFAELIKLLKIYDEESPEAFKQAIVEHYVNKEDDFTNLIFSAISFSTNMNFFNESHQEVLNFMRENELLKFTQNDPIPYSILPAFKMQLQEIMPELEKAGMQIFPKSIR